MRAREAMRDSLVYEPADSVVSARAGSNRFVWNLRYPGATKLKNTLVDEGTLDGPMALPGNSSVRLIAGRDTVTRIESMQSQLDQRVSLTKEQSYAKRVADAAKPLREKLEAIRAERYEVGCHVDQCSLDQPMKLYNILMSI